MLEYIYGHNYIVYNRRGHNTKSKAKYKYYFDPSFPHSIERMESSCKPLPFKRREKKALIFKGFRPVFGKFITYLVINRHRTHPHQGRFQPKIVTAR